MKKKNGWKLVILPAILFVLGFGAYLGYSILQQDDQTNSTLTPAQKKELEKVAVFEEENTKKDYRNVTEFISDFHKQYNQTLGWGRIDSVDWKEQRDIAGEILEILSSIRTEHADLQTDFKQIESYAKTIEQGKKDKGSLLYLHRYFHDLDIEFNGYNKTGDYFHVTEFKAKND